MFYTPARFLLSSSPLLACLLFFSLSVHSAPKDNERDALIQAQQHLEHKINRISMFHHSARSSMTESLQIPLFKEYFKLPESHSYYHDNLGRIQLTAEQHNIRKQMEDWILTLHSRFPIGETCLIDSKGQEHLRVVGGAVKPPHMFSSEEHGSPFFTPTFNLQKGEVHISNPYLSEDSQYWVTSFTSPIFLDDRTIPGFYHFEVPLAAYSDLISFKEFSFTQFKSNVPDLEEEGRNFIINDKYQVIADSESKFNFNLPDERNPDINPNLPDYLPPEKLEDYTGKLSLIFPEQNSANIARQMYQQRQGTIYMKMMGRKYLVVFAPVPDRPDWILAHLDPIGGPAYWESNIINP